jgi:hypothetical protein
VESKSHSTTCRGNADGKINAAIATTKALIPIRKATKAVGRNSSSKQRIDPARSQSIAGLSSGISISGVSELIKVDSRVDILIPASVGSIVCNY